MKKINEKLNEMQKAYDNCDCERDFDVNELGTFEDLVYLMEKYQHFKHCMNYYPDYEYDSSGDGKRQRRIIEACYFYYQEHLAELACYLVDRGMLINYVPPVKDYDDLDDSADF